MGISRNPDITMEMIEKHLDKPWSWYSISSNQKITMDFIEKNKITLILNGCLKTNLLLKY